MNNNVNNFYSNDQSNNLAIVGFILSFFVPIAGLILSIYGYKKAKEINNGKGLSIAGIIISSVLMFISILAIVFVIIISYYIFKNNVSDLNSYYKPYCEKAYDCVETSYDNYSCKYKIADKEYTITCNGGDFKVY